MQEFDLSSPPLFKMEGRNQWLKVRLCEGHRTDDPSKRYFDEFRSSFIPLVRFVPHAYLRNGENYFLAKDMDHIVSAGDMIAEECYRAFMHGQTDLARALIGDRLEAWTNRAVKDYFSAKNKGIFYNAVFFGSIGDCWDEERIKKCSEASIGLKEVLGYTPEFMIPHNRGRMPFPKTEEELKKEEEEKKVAQENDEEIPEWLAPQNAVEGLASHLSNLIRQQYISSSTVPASSNQSYTILPWR